MKLLIFINVDWYCALHWKDRIEYWISRGIEVHLVTNFTDYSRKQEFIDLGAKCHHISLERKTLNPFKALASSWTFFRLINLVKPDLIHTITVKPNVFGGFIARSLGIPTMLSITGLGRAFDSSAPIYFRLVRKLTCKVYNFIATNPHNFFVFENSHDRDLLLAENAVKKESSFVVNGAGIDLNQFKSTSITRGRRVLFASRLLWSKGLKDLIEAKKLVENTENDFELLVAGIIDSDAHDAIPFTYIEKMQREGLIIWLGQVHDMPALINDVDVVALPTTYNEGIPRILIEAAACGKPLIATNTAGCREIVLCGENGILVPPKNPEAINKAINEILNSPEKYEQFSACSLGLAREKFANSVIFNQYMSLYDQLATSSSRIAST